MANEIIHLREYIYILNYPTGIAEQNSRISKRFTPESHQMCEKFYQKEVRWWYLSLFLYLLRCSIRATHFPIGPR